MQQKNSLSFLIKNDIVVCTIILVVNSLLSAQAEKKMRVSGNPVELSLFEKPKPVPVIGKTIVVSGIPSTLDQDDILGFFENPRKGGGQTESILPGDQGVSIITFADQSGALTLYLFLRSFQVCGVLVVDYNLEVRTSDCGCATVLINNNHLRIKDCRQRKQRRPVA